MTSTERGEGLLNVKDVAAILGVSPLTLYDWRYRKVGPPSIKVGAAVRFRRRDVEAWIDSQAAGTPSGAA